MKANQFSYPFIGFIVLMCGCDKIIYSERTVYSDGFSERNFERVKLGMSIQEVEMLLGKPLDVVTQQYCETWSYCPETTEAFSGNATNKLEFDLFGKIGHLSFSSSGTVFNVSGNYLVGDFTGKEKDQVLASLGKPTKIKIEDYRIAFRYTAPKNHGTFKIREIHFSATNDVRLKIEKTHYD